MKRITRLGLIGLTSLLMAACGADAPGTTGGNTVDDNNVSKPDQPVATQALGPANRPALGTQIDRVGRPAVGTALIGAFHPDETAKGMLKDDYNSNSDPASWRDAYAGEIMGNLAILDALDADCGNQLVADAGEKRYEFLATVLADDRLYVHSDRSECGEYLGLEAEIVGAIPQGAGGCGGREPADDVIERSYSALAAGLLAGVDDGVSADDAPLLPNFPFLATPTE